MLTTYMQHMFLKIRIAGSSWISLKFPYEKQEGLFLNKVNFSFAFKVLVNKHTNMSNWPLPANDKQLWLPLYDMGAISIPNIFNTN